MPETSDPWQLALDDLWNTQSRWSGAANNRKKSLRSWTGPLVIMGFVGVVLSTLSPYLVAKTGAKPEDWTLLQYVLTLAGPVLVSVAALLTRELLGPKSEQSWIKAREASEALKAEGFVYAAGALPYGDPAQAPLLLATKVSEIVKEAGAADDLPAPAKRSDEKPGTPIDAQQYIETRVEHQINEHDKKGNAYADKLRKLRGVVIAMMVVSATLGVIAGVGQRVDVNIWIAVVSTALATVTAYVTASRLEFLAASYASSARRLESARRIWVAKKLGPREQQDRFILDCEAIVAAQNRAWADELLKRVDAAAPPAAGDGEVKKGS